MTRSLLRALTAALLACLLLAPSSQARPSSKKGIWGPVRVSGVSQFPIYKELGARFYNTSMRWPAVAPTKPAKPTDPADPAYRWPAELDDAIAEAGRNGMKVVLLVQSAPRWANGGQPGNVPPKKASDFGTFIAAAAKRYPAVDNWVIWGEPTRAANFAPVPPTNATRPLKLRARRAVSRYAGLLDAAYGALKRVDRRNLVIGGNSFTGGDISPFNWIRYMRLANGKRPRMDFYGHNPFTLRRPQLSKTPAKRGYADFSDLDDLAGWLDRYYGRDPRGRPLRIWIGEFFAPTDHPNVEFNGFVTQAVQASWLRDALRITRSFKRIAVLNWLGLYDDPPRPAGDEVNRGLIDVKGRHKPSFDAYKNG